MSKTSVTKVFLACYDAIKAGKAIKRSSKRDKEFLLQDWFSERLGDAKLKCHMPSRNKYPDFRLVDFPEGYEVKGLEFPGRRTTFDANSQPPSGQHKGYTVFYVFGRYPKYVESLKEYPLIDLVICHGDFLNSDHGYVHKNESFSGFGSYGDIMIRDRKMYVVPTPFELLKTIDLNEKVILILPEELTLDPEDKDSQRLLYVGDVIREEAKNLVIEYSFNLKTNKLKVKTKTNPNAGLKRKFKVYTAKSHIPHPPHSSK